LTRLRNDELVETYWRESLSGPPRRYYRITASGIAALTSFREQWQRFRTAVDGIFAASDHLAEGQ